MQTAIRQTSTVVRNLSTKLVTSTKNSQIITHQKPSPVKAKTDKAHNSLTFQARKKTNNQWKEDTFSLSAIYRYIMAEKNTAFQEWFGLECIKYGVDFEITGLRKKDILENLTEKQRYDKNGDMKLKFSLWTMQGAITKIIKTKVKQ